MRKFLYENDGSAARWAAIIASAFILLGSACLIGAFAKTKRWLKTAKVAFSGESYSSNHGRTISVGCRFAALDHYLSRPMLAGKSRHYCSHTPVADLTPQTLCRLSRFVIWLVPRQPSTR